MAYILYLDGWEDAGADPIKILPRKSYATPLFYQAFWLVEIFSI